MLLDIRSLPDGETVQTDICIVGAGAAGIAIARELVGSGLKVCLLESGGLEYDEPTHELNHVRNVGELTLNLDYFRARYFGGTTNLWGGNCAPLDPIDFEARPWIPASGWPIQRDDLEPYYHRAQPYFELPDHGYDPDEWARAVPEFAAARLPVHGGPVAEKLYQRSPRTAFGERYRADLAPDSCNVTVLLHANAVGLDTDEDARTVRAVRVATLDGKRYAVAARLVILAAGIENARLLLLSSDRMPAGLGNGHDVVGRYFTEHLNVVSGEVLLPDRFGAHAFYDIEGWADRVSPTRVPMVVGLQPTPEAQAREGIANYVAFIAETARAEQSPGYRAARRLLGRVRRGQIPENAAADLGALVGDFGSVVRGGYDHLFGGGTRVFRFQHFFEQVPNPDSRLTLADERDALGLPMMQVAWRTSALDKRTLARGQDLVIRALGQAGVGRVRPEFTAEDQPWPDALGQSSHYMGTTRMSDGPRTGVVDRDCRVHGTTNLFVAGGSVLPTGGAAMVTINIVTLAIRLADHARKELRA